MLKINRFSTFFYVQLNIKSRKLIYVNTGHNPPFVIHKNGEVSRLEEGDAVVRMLPTMFINYTQGEIQFETAICSSATRTEFRKR